MHRRSALYSRLDVREEVKTSDGRRVLAQLAEGLSFVGGNFIVREPDQPGWLFNALFGLSYITLLPVFADAYFGMGSTGYGLAERGARRRLAARHLDHRDGRASASCVRAMVMLCAAASMGLALMTFSRSPGMGVAFPMLALTGFCSTFYLTHVATASSDQGARPPARPRLEPLLALLEPAPARRAAGRRAGGCASTRASPVLVGGALGAANALVLLTSRRAARDRPLPAPTPPGSPLIAPDPRLGLVEDAEVARGTLSLPSSVQASPCRPCRPPGPGWCRPCSDPRPAVRSLTITRPTIGLSLSSPLQAVQVFGLPALSLGSVRPVIVPVSLPPCSVSCTSGYRLAGLLVDRLPRADRRLRRRGQARRTPRPAPSTPRSVSWRDPHSLPVFSPPTCSLTAGRPFAELELRGLWRRHARTGREGERPDPSTPSGGWRRAPLRCHPGSIHRRGSDRASADRPGTWRSRRTPAAVRWRRAGTYWPAGGRVLGPLRTASCTAPNPSDIAP